MSMHTYIYTYITHIYVNKRMYIHTCLPIYINTCIKTYVFTYPPTYMNVLLIHTHTYDVCMPLSLRLYKACMLHAICLWLSLARFPFENRRTGGAIFESSKSSSEAHGGPAEASKQDRDRRARCRSTCSRLQQVSPTKAATSQHEFPSSAVLKPALPAARVPCNQRVFPNFTTPWGAASFRVNLALKEKVERKGLPLWLSGSGANGRRSPILIHMCLSECRLAELERRIARRSSLSQTAVRGVRADVW